MPADPLDLVDFAALTPDALDDAAREAIAACDAALDALGAVPAGERTFANTLLALEEAVEPVSFAAGVLAFMAYVSADDSLREKGREVDQQLDKYMVGLSFREDIYEAIRSFASSEEAAHLRGEDARYLAFELRDYRRNGFDLAPERRARLRAVFDELVDLGTAFRNAIDDWDDAIFVTREELGGLPEAFIDGLTVVQGDDGPRFRVSLDYPELFPFLANAESEPRRRELFEKDQRKGGPENVERLERAIALRTEAARILGHDCWASYVLEVRMAADRQAVEGFLDRLEPSLAAKAERDLAGLRRAKAEHGSEEQLNIWDWRFYHNALMKTRYAVDEFAVSEYFPLQACLDGLFSTLQPLLGVRFVASPGAARWHDDVQAFDVFEADGDVPFARFYMDLFPRPNKYGHAAAFTLRRGRRLADGSYQAPVSAIVANFTKPTASQPSLLRHSELVTLWHEFGHILHQTLTRAARSRFSGTATERDFVEAPSQMLEHWCWEPSVLASFARHHRTGEPIPRALIDAMVAARNLDSGVVYLRQLFFARLDMALHSPDFDGDSTAAVASLHKLTGFPHTPGTHFQSGFGHLFGYDAGYYGYLWSQVFGDDMYTAFAGNTDATTGARYRRAILEPGGSIDGGEMVRAFLGREPDPAAFFTGLGLDE